MAVKTRKKARKALLQPDDAMPVRVEAEPLRTCEVGATHSQVAQRAFLIWLTKGRPHGRDLEHWCEAESQLKNEATDRYAIKT